LWEVFEEVRGEALTAAIRTTKRLVEEVAHKLFEEVAARAEEVREGGEAGQALRSVFHLSPVCHFGSSHSAASEYYWPSESVPVVLAV
jgi:hypothetical protein